MKKRVYDTTILDHCIIQYSVNPMRVKEATYAKVEGWPMTEFQIVEWENGKLITKRKYTDEELAKKTWDGVKLAYEKKNVA